MIVKAIPDANDFPNGGTCPRRQDFIGSDQCTVNIRHHQAYIFRASSFCLPSNPPLTNTIGHVTGRGRIHSRHP